MTYTVVIPPVQNATRQALNDILAAIIAAFMANTPGVVRKYWSEVPQSLTGEGPFVYQGPINEDLTHDSGIRTTTYRGSLGYVDVLADPQETNTRCNTWADFMREMFTFNARISVGATGTGSVDAVLRETRLVDGPTELVQGNARLTDMLLEFEFNVQEGRN